MVSENCHSKYSTMQCAVMITESVLLPNLKKWKYFYGKNNLDTSSPFSSVSS